MRRFARGCLDAAPPHFPARHGAGPGPLEPFSTIFTLFYPLLTLWAACRASTGPIYASFFGTMGVASAIVFTCGYMLVALQIATVLTIGNISRLRCCLRHGQVRRRHHVDGCHAPRVDHEVHCARCHGGYYWYLWSRRWCARVGQLGGQPVALCVGIAMDRPCLLVLSRWYRIIVLNGILTLFHSIRTSRGMVQLAAGLSVGLSGLAAGYAIGIAGDAGVRGTGQQPRLFVGMILILIFAEVLGLYGWVKREVRCFLRTHRHRLLSIQSHRRPYPQHQDHFGEQGMHPLKWF